jgi:hypothetical protein
MEPIEILTLVPLATLIVVFGVQPGLLLDLVQGTVDATLGVAESGTALAIDPLVTWLLLGLIVLGILARIGWALVTGGNRSSGATVAPSEGGAAH